MDYGTGGRFGGGPRWGWGAVPGPGTTGSRGNFNTGQVRGPGTSPEAGLHRGEWQWRGHGPGSWNDYAWEYRGGVARDRTLRRSDADIGPRGSLQRRLAEQRSGGLPRGRERYDADRWFAHLGEGRYDRGYGRGWRGR